MKKHSLVIKRECFLSRSERTRAKVDVDRAKQIEHRA